MNSDPKVQVTSEPGVKGQFGKGRFSYQSGTRASSHVAVGSCAALAVGVCAVVLSGSPKQDASDKTSGFLGVEVKQVTVEPIANLEIPRADDPGVKPAPGSNGAKRVVFFPGAEVIKRPRSVTIPPGAIVLATLISGASDGPVKAELQEPLMIAGETLLEAGTTLVGTGNSGNERLIIRFRKAIFKDGSVAAVNAQAADSSDKIAGLKGSRVGYRAVKLAAGIGLNFIGGMSAGLQQTQGQQGAVVSAPTMKNALLNGAAVASLQEGQNLMNEYKDEKPVIEVDAGTKLFILFEDNS